MAEDQEIPETNGKKGGEPSDDEKKNLNRKKGNKDNLKSEAETRSGARRRAGSEKTGDAPSCGAGSKKRNRDCS